VPMLLPPSRCVQSEHGPRICHTHTQPICHGVRAGLTALCQIFDEKVVVVYPVALLEWHKFPARELGCVAGAVGRWVKFHYCDDRLRLVNRIIQA